MSRRRLWSTLCGVRREWQPTFDAMATPFSAIAGAYATLEDDVLQLYFVFGARFGCVCEVVCWHFMTQFSSARHAVFGTRRGGTL